MACPGERQLGNITFSTVYQLANGTNATWYRTDRVVSAEVPQSLVDLFQSGVERSLVSGFFDVQYRQWLGHHDVLEVDNFTILESAYKTLGSSILNNKYEILDGIILDTINGMTLCLSNHTISSDSHSFDYCRNHWIS